MSNNTQRADRIVHAVSGGLGGAAALVVTYPLVAVSCHQQTNKKKSEAQKKLEDPANKKEEETKDEKAVTALDLVKEIYHSNGLLGFYSGMESAIYGMALTNFIYYYFYESAGRMLIKNRRLKRLRDFSVANLQRVALQGLSPIESIVTGSIAGSITALVTNPFWVVNTRCTVTKTNKSFLTVFLDIFKKEGVKSLFNGVLPALVLVINPIIQYTVFEQIKNLVLKTRAKRGVTSSGGSLFKPIDAFFIGALSKLIATGVTYPYITLKSRMHLQSNKKEDKKGGQTSSSAPQQQQKPVKAKSMTGLLLDIVKNEGFAGLYNGIFVKLSQSIFTAAFLFLFKEELVNLTMKLVLMIRLLRAKKLIKK